LKCHAAARLKQEAPQKEETQDDGERNDDDLDESHRRFLTVKAFAPCSRKDFIGAASDVSTSDACLVKACSVVIFKKTVRENNLTGSAHDFRKPDKRNARRFIKNRTECYIQSHRLSPGKAEKKWV